MIRQIGQSVADILGRHVKLAVEAIDRMYLNTFVPRLQREPGVVGFFRRLRGQPLPSAALMSPMSRAFVSELEGFAAKHEIPLVTFRKGERKDDVMAEHLRRFDKDEGEGPRGWCSSARRILGQASGEGAGVPH